MASVRRGGIGFVLQRDCEPVLRTAFPASRELCRAISRVSKFSTNCPLIGFEAGAVVFHDYVAAVGEDAQLG